VVSGQLYAVTTNPLGATGDGWALAHEVGAELRDLEFLQFHPTALKLAGVNPAPLISEAVRGAGAHLVEQDGRRFALDADPRGELGPRDVVARVVQEADARGGAFLDARHLEDFAHQFPGIHAMLARYGLDPATDLLPVAPALHYAMGGIRTDLDGHASVDRLWAAGEVASTGVHGANRLASNSLLEGLVFADRVAREVLREVGSDDVVAGVTPTAGDADAERGGHDAACEEIRREMRAIMTGCVGLVRTEETLLEAERQLQELERRTPETAWRTRRQLLVARLITASARHRRRERRRPPAGRLSTPKEAYRLMPLELPVIEPSRLSPGDVAALQSEIRRLAKERGAVVLAHNYQRRKCRTSPISWATPSAFRARPRRPTPP
jgi:aspartate oxidase